MPRGFSGDRFASTRAMSEPALKRTVTVANREGLHARPAVLIAKEARRFDARVVIAKGLHEVEATDVLQLMSLGAAQGEQLSLEGSGSEGQEAVEAIEQLFLKKFDED
jgi:phosphotransferase system HPr (HPr) family protein